jgi:hypothetical protein
VAALLDERARQLDGGADDRVDLDGRPDELDLAGPDARGVEQIVDEAPEVAHLALDHGELAGVVGRGAHADQLERARDRRERVAELVAEHREQLVLGAAARLGGIARDDQVLDQAHVDERGRARVGERREERDLAVVRFADGGPVRADRADGRLGADRRHDEALHERLPVDVMRDPRIGEDVLDDGRGAVGDGPAGDAARGGEPPALPQGADRVLVEVVDLIVLAQHERDAIGADSRRAAPRTISISSSSVRIADSRLVASRSSATSSTLTTRSRNASCSSTGRSMPMRPGRDNRDRRRAREAPHRGSRPLTAPLAGGGPATRRTPFAARRAETAVAYGGAACMRPRRRAA